MKPPKPPKPPHPGEGEAPVWTQRVFDQFVDAQFTRLTAHTPDQGNAYADIHPAWQTDITGTHATPAFIGSVTINTTPLTPDQAASIVVINDVSVDLLVRAAGSPPDGWNGYAARLQGSPFHTVQLFRVDGGVDTQLGSDVGYTFVSGMVLRLEVVGSTLRVLLDDVEQIRQDDATYAAGFVGLRDTGGASELIDQFFGYDQEMERPVQGRVG